MRNRAIRYLVALVMVPAFAFSQVAVTGGGGVTVDATNLWSALNEFSGQTNISGPDATTNVEIGSTANDANAGSGGSSVAIGDLATVGNNARSTAVGAQIIVSGANAVAIGAFAKASASGVSIGDSAGFTAQGTGAILLNAQSGAANAFVAGGTQAITDVYFGEGIVNTTAASYTIHGTGGSGSDNAGADVTIMAGLGTGTGAGSQVNLDRPLMRATSSTVQASANGLTVCESKTLSNTSATVTSLATVGLASNSGGAVRITVSVRCDDGTNFDSDLVTSYVAFVNKATVLTVGTPVTTASAAANNSGSCTVAPTFTAGAALININVTPVITTIVPTTVTAAVNIENFGAGAVTCN